MICILFLEFVRFAIKSQQCGRGHLQLLRERLSYKRGKAFAAMSKVVMGNGGFHGCLSEP